IDLERGALPRASFRGVLARRRSSTAGTRCPLPLRDLGALLEASYAAALRAPGAVRRPVPSGGALYPLELYLLALDVDGIEPAVLHYNPFRHRLETLAALDTRAAGAVLVDPALADGA